MNIRPSDAAIRDLVVPSYLATGLLALRLFSRKIERWMERIADRANPILVEFLEALSRKNGGSFLGISSY